VASGGQAGTSPRIENYLGFPTGISGGELAERAAIQARKFGAAINVPAEAVGLAQRDDHYVIEIKDDEAVATQAVVVATGARYRKLEVPRLEEFEGTSVYYAATQMEAMLCGHGPVAVVGGGNSAGQAALFLSQHVERVHLLIRGDDLAKGMSRYLVTQVERNDKVEVLLNTEVRELVGDGSLDAIVVENTATGESRRLGVRALFVFIGAEPHTGWLADQVLTDERGFILTGNRLASAVRGGEWADRAPLLLESSRRGVFAAGDVRSGSIKRVAWAVGEGSMAVRLVHEHLGSQQPGAVPRPPSPGLLD
jgi:thioredoxin reductase (NADPH)